MLNDNLYIRVTDRSDFKLYKYFECHVHLHANVSLNAKCLRLLLIFKLQLST